MSIMKKWKVLVAKKEKFRDDIVNDWNWPNDARKKADQIILEKLGNEFPDSTDLDAMYLISIIIAAMFTLITVFPMVFFGLPKTPNDVFVVVLMGCFAALGWIGVIICTVKIKRNITTALIVLQSVKDTYNDAVLDSKLEEL